MAITAYLERNARDFGEEISLIEINPEMEGNGGTTWREAALVEARPGSAYRHTMTWADFDDRANRTAQLLLSQGIKRGEKVAILLVNCIQWLPIYFGILKAGAIVVPLNFRYAADEIKYCLDLSEASAILFGPEFIERMEQIHQDIPAVRLKLYHASNEGPIRPAFAGDYDALLLEASSENPGLSFRDEEDAAIYFSSGTTGFPKAILHSHQSLISACITEQAHHNQGREDIFLCIPPLYHTGAKMHWFGSLLSGSRAVLLRGVKPQWIIETAAREQATIVWLLVPWAQDILDAIERGEVRLEGYDLSHWRLMHIGAQPVPPSLVKRWKQVFPGHAYDTNYGLSESIGPGAVHLGMENIHKVGAIGKAGHGWQTKIVDEGGKPVAPGQVGELILLGPGLMTCYYRDPEATAQTLRDGWLYTGDMAREDEEGFIYLVDRKKDVIITGGENLYPVQIEDFLRDHDKISDVAVIGLSDERLGEIAAAIIQLKPGEHCDVEEILAFCKGLPRYKRPKQILFDQVPRNPTGKIEKTKLRQKYAGGSLVEKQTTK